MHRLSHNVVAAEGEGNIADASADLAAGQGGFDDPGRLNERNGVVVMLLDSRGDREDVGIENDILGRDAHLFGKDTVGTGADIDLALHGIGLTLLVKGHHDHRRSIAVYQARSLLEYLFA